MNLLRLLVLFAFFLLPSAVHARGPVVLAAASLQESLTDAARKWSAKGHPRPVLSFASSAVLARQAIGGAPADIFISADSVWMDAVADRQLLVKDSRADLLRNRLALIAPAGTRAQLVLQAGRNPARELLLLLGNGRIAMGEPNSVPAGRYGRMALENMGAWNSVKDRIAAADNVRSALKLVSSGNAPLGIVYATDVNTSASVRLISLFPESTHPPIVYPAALLKGASKDAAAFHAFLLSCEGQKIFRSYGFQACAC